MLKITSGTRISFDADSQAIRYFSYKSVIFVVAEGKALFDGNTLGDGEAFYLRAGMRISIAPCDGTPCSFFKFEMDGNDSEGLIKSFSSEYTAILSAETPSTLLKIATALCDSEYRSISDTFDEAAAKLLLSLLTPAGADNAVSEYGNQYVDRAVRYINRNYSQRIRVEALAEILGIDRMYLRNLFAQYVGMSTMDYIMNVRMTRAKELLSVSDISVSNVALSVGYADVLCFSKAFRKFTGVSPTEYRENRLEQNQKQERKTNQIPVFIL